MSFSSKDKATQIAKDAIKIMGEEWKIDVWYNWDYWHASIQYERYATIHIDTTPVTNELSYSCLISDGEYLHSGNDCWTRKGGGFNCPKMAFQFAYDALQEYLQNLEPMIKSLAKIKGIKK